MVSSLSSGQESRIAEFWQAFLREEPAWRSLGILEKNNTINAFVGQYYPKFAFEFFDLPERKDVMGLCITAHGNVEEFPLLMELVQAAPPLAHYEIHAFRSRTKGGGAGFNIEMAGLELRTSDVLIGYYGDGQRVGLQIRFASKIPPELEKNAQHMAFILLDHVIGEYDFAIKVGPVEFVQAWGNDIKGSTSLDKFPPLFDRFWAEELGHTGLFPSSTDQKWQVMQVTQKSDTTPAGGPDERSLVSVNESAKTLAMRADLSLAMTLSLPLSDKGALDFAQEKQYQIGEAMEQKQLGVFALAMFKKEYRHAVYYVSDRDAAQKLIEQTIGSNAFELRAEHDFSWSKYRYFADVPDKEPPKE
jgi:hypothetical protein